MQRENSELLSPVRKGRAEGGEWATAANAQARAKKQEPRTHEKESRLDTGTS